MIYKLLTRNNVCTRIKGLFSICTHVCTTSRSFKLSGVYPPIVTCFDEEGNLALDKLQHNLEKWRPVPLRGFVVFGTNGEYVSLSEEEKISIVKCVKDFVPSEKLVIVGSGCESTAATIALTNKMADVGANAALVVNPCYNKSLMTEDALYEHYIKVADSSKIPLIVYNVPANTGIDMSPTLLIRLSSHPNIIGMKESGGDITKIGFIVHKTKEENFQVLAGSASFLYSALCVGCVGGIMALANPLAQEVYDLYEHAVNGEHDEARDLQLRLIGPNLCVTKWFGIPGVKASMNLLGLYGGPCRSPLKPILPNDLAKLIKEFKINGFL